MEVILLENIKKLGSIGDRVKVKNGYGRNFLIKFNKAMIVNKENIEIFERKKSEFNKKNELEKNKAKDIFKLINNTKIQLRKEMTENGKLYGSVTPKEISKAINDAKNVEIQLNQIEIKEQIKSQGEYKIDINLHAEVQAKIEIEILPIA